MIRLSYHLEYIAVKYGLNIRGCPNFLLASVAHMKHYKSWNWLYHWGTLHVVEGWVEPNPVFVGFRCTQPNLHFVGAISKCETQQRPIS